MSMGSMGGSQYGGMGAGNDAYGSQPIGAPPSGFGGQSYGPPSTYALPSGIGGPSPYMSAGGYGQMQPGGQNQGGFDSRAEQAFHQGSSNAVPGAQSGYGANGSSYTGGNNASGYGGDASDVSLAFLSSGMGNLGFGESRENRNGQGGAKSPQ